MVPGTTMTELDRQVSYWDGVAAEKAFTHPLDVARFRGVACGAPRILDYGCGYGRTCAELASLGYQRVTGVDISERMIARGHAQFPELDLRVQAGVALSFPPATFDVCILFAVLTCIPTDEGQRSVITELGRVLRPGGTLYVSDYPIQEDGRNQARYREFEQEYGTFGVFRLPDGAVVRHHEMNRVHDLLARFDLAAERVLDVPTMNGNPAKVFQIFARKGQE